MAYCVNCGQQHEDDVKFCPNCGTQAAKTGASSSQRQQEFTGKINKCPNCGETLNAFVASCPSCGYELREIQASKSRSEFNKKLENADTENKKIELIRTFPIPNTKEDIFEFIILASTNITGELRKEIVDAWLAKLESCYQKAKLVFGDDSDFSKIQEI